MSTFIVLASHGAPPNDFPHSEMGEYFRLHSQLEAEHSHHHGGQTTHDVKQRFEELDRKMRNWTRNEKNDPFYAGTVSLAKELEAASGLPVIVGFNEYCAPSLDEALELAVTKGASKVAVVTPMMTSGGSHSEQGIPETIRKARLLNPGMEFVYAWPFDRAAVAAFLASQVASFVEDTAKQNQG